MKSKLQEELENLRAQLAKIEKECEDLNAIIVRVSNFQSYILLIDALNPKNRGPSTSGQR